jgi:hypothetical protein
MRAITRKAVKTGIVIAMAVAACATATTGAEAATGTGGFTIINASDYANGTTVVHVCHILGTDDDYHEAIVCVDINTMIYDGYAYAQGEVEAYCQDDDGDDTQCANITVKGQFSEGSDGVLSTYDAYCGHQYGACPTGRLYDYVSGNYAETAPEGDGSCGTDADSNANFWSIADGLNTTVELPGSDDTYTLDDTGANDGENESTGHYYICY